MHEDNKNPTQARHPIGVASTRTGVAQDALRAWERRYGAVVPHRSESGRRLYSDADLTRLGLLRRLVEAGRRISDIARLSDVELRALADEDRQALGAGGPGIRPASPLDAALDAARKLDKERLEKVLSEALLDLGQSRMRSELIVPLLHELGARWRRGEMRIVHEHLASTIVRKFMDGLRDRAPSELRPRLVVSTPTGQRHELGAILAAVAAEEVGWEAIYLGADLPAEEIALAARSLEARAVALSIVFQDDEPSLLEEMRSIRDALSPEIAILVGGRASETVRARLLELGVVLAPELSDFQERLEALVIQASG